MFKGEKVWAIVPARAGSKGLPGKNKKKLAGKPLLAWSIAHAGGSSRVDRVIASTDAADLAAIAKRAGADVPFLRPRHLAADRTPMFDVVEHLLKTLRAAGDELPGYVVLLQPTSPLRTSGDIDRAFDLLRKYPSAQAVIGVVEVEEHPYWMKTLKNGLVSPFMKNIKKPSRRQDLPVLYKTNGAIYICRTEDFLKHKTFFPPNTAGYVMSRENSVDIDDLFDFQQAEAILKRRR